MSVAISIRQSLLLLKEKCKSSPLFITIEIAHDRYFINAAFFSLIYFTIEDKESK
jgi:hypothetical protein